MTKTDQLLSVVKEAGQVLADHFTTQHESSAKDQFHYEIELDKKLDDFYRQKLSQIEPEAVFYSEENQSVGRNTKRWIVDAIEGTTNFTYHNKFFATQCALELNGVVESAVIVAPQLDEVYVVKDGKSFLNDKLLHISDMADTKKCVFSVGKGTSQAERSKWHLIMGEMLKHYHTPRLLGATGLELSMVARGGLDCMVLAGSHYYDIAAGLAMVRQAGGIGLNLRGEDWVEHDEILIAGGSKIVQDVLTKLQKVLK